MILPVRPINEINYSVREAAFHLWRDFNTYRQASDTSTALKTVADDISLYRSTRKQLLPVAAEKRTGTELSPYRRDELERRYAAVVEQRHKLPGFTYRVKTFTRYLDETLLADYQLQLNQALAKPPQTLDIHVPYGEGIDYPDGNALASNFGRGTFHETRDGRLITSYNPLVIEEDNGRFLYFAREAAPEEREYKAIKALTRHVEAKNPAKPLTLVFHKFSSAEDAIDFNHHKIDTRVLRLGQLEDVMGLQYSNPTMNVRFFDFTPPITATTAQKLESLPRTALFQMKYAGALWRLQKYYPHQICKRIFGERLSKWLFTSSETKFVAKKTRLLSTALALEAKMPSSAAPITKILRFSSAAKIMAPLAIGYGLYSSWNKGAAAHALDGNRVGSNTKRAIVDGFAELAGDVMPGILSGYVAARALKEAGHRQLGKTTA